MARELNNRGLAAVVMVLPFHLTRTPKGTRSGELALQADPQRLVGTMLQSVADLRRTLDWIQTRPEFEKDHTGLAGTSLGGIVASLGFAVEPRFKSGVFVLAGADIAGIIWDSSRVIAQRDAMRRRGYTEDKLRKELAVVEPLAYLKKDDPRPKLVIAASHDTVVPPRFARLLIDALDTQNEVWLPTGHYGGALARGRIVRTVVRFFEDQMRGQPSQEPGSIPALPLWFGLVYSAE